MLLITILTFQKLPTPIPFVPHRVSGWLPGWLAPSKDFCPGSLASFTSCKWQASLHWDSIITVTKAAPSSLISHPTPIPLPDPCLAWCETGNGGCRAGSDGWLAESAALLILSGLETSASRAQGSSQQAFGSPTAPNLLGYLSTGPQFPQLVLWHVFTKSYVRTFHV